MIRKNVSQVLEFLRKQPQQVGTAKLLGVKVLLLGNDLDVAKKICANITRSNTWFKAHMKSNSEPVLSVWYGDLEPCLGSICYCTEDFAEEVVQLFREQTKKEGNIQLLSIKVILPEKADTNKISKYIVKNYPEYKVQSKRQGGYPVVAIGDKKRE